jgi:hypothetical protein
MLMKIVIAMSAAALLVAAAFAAQAPASAPQTAGGEGWRSFEGTLSASGQRHTLPTETGRPAVAVLLSGAVSLTAGEGLSRGFRGEVIGFDDGAGLTVLRGVWTDDRGDRIFSRLKGESIAAGRRISGEITGGTGRYAGITGEYSFDWQYVVEAEAGTISGRGTGLRGRYRDAGAGK